MATQKQNAANRRNAQRSTGPRSPDGKARAAMNNFKHGIYAQPQVVPGEDPAQRQALEDAYLARFNPQTIELLYLVYVLIELHWEDLRLAKADANLWTYGVKGAYKPEPDTVLGQAFQNNRETFIFLGRRRDANHRKYLATLRELESLQPIPLPDDLDDVEHPQPADPAPQAPAAAPPPQPEPVATAPQPVETAPQTPEMGSNPENSTPSPTPQTAHPLHPRPIPLPAGQPLPGMAPQPRSPAH